MQMILGIDAEGHELSAEMLLMADKICPSPDYIQHHHINSCALKYFGEVSGISVPPNGATFDIPESVMRWIKSDKPLCIIENLSPPRKKGDK